MTSGGKQGRSWISLSSVLKIFLSIKGSLDILQGRNRCPEALTATCSWLQTSSATRGMDRHEAAKLSTSAAGSMGGSP